MSICIFPLFWNGTVQKYKLLRQKSFLWLNYTYIEIMYVCLLDHPPSCDYKSLPLWGPILIQQNFVFLFKTVSLSMTKRENNRMVSMT